MFDDEDFGLIVDHSNEIQNITIKKNYYDDITKKKLPINCYDEFNITQFLIFYESWKMENDLSKEDFIELCCMNCDDMNETKIEFLWQLPYSKNFIIKVIANYQFSQNDIKLFCDMFENKVKLYEKNIFNFYSSCEHLKKDYMNIPNLNEIIEIIEKFKSKFVEKEINIVADQAHVNYELAIIALEINEGDIVYAIMYLTI